MQEPWLRSRKRRYAELHRAHQRELKDANCSRGSHPSCRDPYQNRAQRQGFAPPHDMRPCLLRAVPIPPITRGGSGGNSCRPSRVRIPEVPVFLDLDLTWMSPISPLDLSGKLPLQSPVLAMDYELRDFTMRKPAHIALTFRARWRLTSSRSLLHLLRSTKQ